MVRSGQCICIWMTVQSVQCCSALLCSHAGEDRTDGKVRSVHMHMHMDDCTDSAVLATLLCGRRTDG